MDIGVWMAKQVLAHKLEARHEKNPEQAWNLSKWPTQFSEHFGANARELGRHLDIQPPLFLIQIRLQHAREVEQFGDHLGKPLTALHIELDEPLLLSVEWSGELVEQQPAGLLQFL